MHVDVLICDARFCSSLSVNFIFFFIYLTYKLQSNTHRCHRIRFKFSFTQIVFFAFHFLLLLIRFDFEKFSAHIVALSVCIHVPNGYFECLSSLCECVVRCSSWHRILFFLIQQWPPGPPTNF